MAEILIGRFRNISGLSNGYFRAETDLSGLRQRVATTCEACTTSEKIS